MTRFLLKKLSYCVTPYANVDITPAKKGGPIDEARQRNLKAA